MASASLRDLPSDLAFRTWISVNGITVSNSQRVDLYRDFYREKRWMSLHHIARRYARARPKLIFIRQFRRLNERYWTWLERQLERVKGIEPSYSAWEAAALPLSYTRDEARFPTDGGRCQVAAAGRLRCGSVSRVSGPGPGSWSRGRSRRGWRVFPAYVRRRGGRRSGRLRG